MNSHERDLADILDRAVGEPPTEIGLPSVLATARRQRRAAVLATTAAALAVAGGVVALAATLAPSDRTVVRQVPGASAPPAHGATTGTPTAVRACSGGAATARVLSTQGAAGTSRWAVAVRSAASVPCSLDGYPALAFHTSSGWLQPVMHHGGYADISSAPRLLTLAPGGTAYVLAYYSDATTAAGGCTSFDRARVLLPGDATPIALSASGCVTASLVHVGPMTTTRPS